MSQKERQRYHLLKMVIGSKITLKETDNLMGVSYRQAKRLKKKLISKGQKELNYERERRLSEAREPISYLIENKSSTQFPCNTREKREALFNCKIWI